MLENASHLTYLSLVKLTSLSLSYKHEAIQKGESGFEPRSFEPVLSNQWSVPQPVLTPKGEPYSWTSATVQQPGVPWPCRHGRGTGLDSAALLPVCCCWPENSCDSFRTHIPSLFLLPFIFLYQSSRAAIMKHHRLSDLQWWSLFLIVLSGYKVKNMVLTDLVSPEASLLGL